MSAGENAKSTLDFSSRRHLAGGHWLGEAVRFAARRQPDHDDRNPAGVEKPPRHCAIQLRGGHVIPVRRDIVDAVDKGGASATVPWRVGRDFGRTTDIVSFSEFMSIQAFPTGVLAVHWKLLRESGA